VGNAIIKYRMGHTMMIYIYIWQHILVLLATDPEKRQEPRRLGCQVEEEKMEN
jgi:hypothetical protein